MQVYHLVAYVVKTNMKSQARACKRK